MKKNQHLSAIPFILFFSCAIFISTVMVAQSGPKPSVEYEYAKKTFRDRRVTSTPITTISVEQLERTYTLTVAEQLQRMNYTPNHVVTNTTTTIRGVGSTNNNLTLVNNTRYGYINNNRNMTYSQSSLYGPNNIPVGSLEQIEVLKGPQGVLYGRNTVSGSVNFTSRADLDTRFTGGVYNPYYTPPTIDYSGIINTYENDWKQEVNTAFSRGAFSEILPDISFGPNGTVIVNVVRNNDFLIETKEYKDAKNNMWLQTETEYYPEGYGSKETKYLDGCGNIEFSRLDLIDHFGYNYNQLNMKYKNNVPEYGYYQPDAGTAADFREYIAVPENLFRLGMFAGTSMIKGKDFYNFNYIQDTKPCKDKDEKGKRSAFDFGLSIRLEDFGFEKKAFPGVNLSYTRFCKPWIGATIDGTLNFGKVNDTKYTILSGFAGPTFIPFSNTLGLDDPFTLSAHILGGYTNVSQKYTGNSSSYGNFSMKFGVGGYYNINDGLGAGFKFSDNLVFNKGNNTSNLSIDAGLRLIF